MAYDYEKFKDLVHYVCQIADRDKLGATKLAKILWYSDIISYINHGNSLTGSAYKKQQFGPVPRDFWQTLEELSSEGKVLIRDVQWFRNLKKEFISLVEPDISRFGASEISMIAQITHDICHHFTAESISDLTHDIIWELADMGEDIPYCAIYGAQLGEITQEDIQWGREAIAKNEAAYGKAA